MPVSHNIEIDLSALPRSIKSFVNAEVKRSTQAGVSVTLADRPSVEIHPGTFASGCFDEPSLSLKVACDKPLDAWLGIFVHESCHRDQFTEGSRVWTRTFGGMDPSTLVGLWLDQVVEFTPAQKEQAISGVMDLELDCERRVLKKIKAFGLPIDAKHYAQKANAYVLFYRALARRRQWYKVGHEPYTLPEVWQSMPTSLRIDYKTVQPALLRKFNACF